MPKAPTSKDVARAAGVSQSTVSYVMSGKRPISEKTRRRVEDAIARLTYQPHAGARALAGHRTNAIAVIMPFRSASTAQRLMAFVEEITLAARHRDHDVLLVTADEGPDGMRRVVGRSLCDAVLVMEVGAADERTDIARELDLPVIFIGVPDDSDGLDCIDFDFESAGELLVDELAALGHRTIDVLGWGPDVVAQRFNYVPRFARGVERAGHEHGTGVSWHHVPDGGDVRPVLERALADQEGRPGLLLVTAVPETMRALSELGLSPGRDADVVALSTDHEAREQALTAVSTQPRDVSRRVMERLFTLLDRDAPTARAIELVPATLVRRASTERR